MLIGTFPSISPAFASTRVGISISLLLLLLLYFSRNSINFFEVTLAFDVYMKRIHFRCFIKSCAAPAPFVNTI